MNYWIQLHSFSYRRRSTILERMVDDRPDYIHAFFGDITSNHTKKEAELVYASSVIAKGIIFRCHELYGSLRWKQRGSVAFIDIFHQICEIAIDSRQQIKEANDKSARTTY